MEKDENSKQKILNAAIKLFAHKGVLRLKKNKNALSSFIKFSVSLLSINSTFAIFFCTPNKPHWGGFPLFCHSFFGLCSRQFFHNRTLNKCGYGSFFFYRQML